ncbi:hypothetical protein BHE74_00023582 [Ensete ventricosum]|nr:hypothetical protein BHE74_00023582 [Ensete ventricosum]
MLGRINSCLDQFLSSCSVGSFPSPARSDQFLSSCSVRSTLAQSDQPTFETSLTLSKIDGSAQDLIFSTLIGNLEKVSSGGGDDMTNIDLAVTSSRPWTIGPPTWPTRHREADLTQARRGQRSYARPNTGKVGKIDIPQLQARASPQGPRTA